MEIIEPVSEAVNEVVSIAKADKEMQTEKRKMTEKQANALKMGRELYKQQREHYRQFVLAQSKPKVEYRDTTLSFV